MKDAKEIEFFVENHSTHSACCSSLMVRFSTLMNKTAFGNIAENGSAFFKTSQPTEPSKMKLRRLVLDLVEVARPNHLMTEMVRMNHLMEWTDGSSRE